MRIPILQKIVLIFSVMTLLILGGIFLFLQWEVHDYTSQRIHTSLKQEIQLARSFLLRSMGPMEISHMDAVADQIGHDLGARVTIIREDGVVLGDSYLSPEEVRNTDNHLYRPEIQQALEKGSGAFERLSSTIHKRLFYEALSFSAPQGKGFIRLAFPTEGVAVIMARLKEVHILALAIAFICTVLLGFFASKRIIQPVLEISRASKAIAAGNFQEPLYIRGQDEIGELAQSVSYMSEQIKSRIDEAVASKSRMEAVLLSMFEGVMVLDAGGQIILVNQSLQKLLRVDDSILHRKPLEAVRNLEIQDIVESILNKKKNVASKEVSVLVPEEKALLIHATRVERDDKVFGAVLVFHDITELRRLENVRKDFVANVSHELRTPITSIKGYAETLLTGAKDDPEHAQEFLHIIYTESDRLAKLVEDILDLSKIESGKFVFYFKPCDLKTLVRQVAATLEKQVQNKHIRLDVQFPQTLALVHGDETALSQVFFNLIDNAIKYNRDGGKVTVTARDAGDRVAVDIQDTGEGIPEKDLSRIFERFYRVDKAHSRELGGTGLGLSIVKHLVQAHKGEIHVRSQAGEGTVFTVFFPKA